MYNDVRYAVSKGSDDSIQIVLADGDGEASGDAARAMKQELDNGVSSYHGRIFNVLLCYSYSARTRKKNVRINWLHWYGKLHQMALRCLFYN